MVACLYTLSDRVGKLRGLGILGILSLGSTEYVNQHVHCMPFIFVYILGGYAVPPTGGQQGQFALGPQCKGAPKQCRTC